MIENEEQYAITANALAEFRAALAAFDDRPEAHPGVHSRLIQAQRDAIESQIETLGIEMREWEQTPKMIPKVRYTVTKASNDGTFTVGDQVWLLDDGSIMSRQMEGWIDPHEVPAATEGWKIEVDENWRDARLAKLRAEVAELEGVADVQD